MQYREFGKIDFKPSALGFGAMRLPVLTDADGRPEFKRIDYPAATAMLHRAIEGGVNYVDTAWMYHEDTCETWLGRALEGGYRERVKIATKMPVWNVKKPSDFDRILGVQLERLQEEHIDFYLLHSLDAAHWKNVVEQGQLAAAERALADGRIGHFGFSFHGTYEDFEEILAATDLWEFCQIQFNYMDEDYQAGRRGLELAAGKGLGVIVMEPVRGGALARNVPPQVQALWDAAPVRRSPAEWALQWVWNEPAVSFLLSGMSTMQHVEEDLVYAGRSQPGLLSAEELALVCRARDVYRDLSPIPCTSCRYCMPCPQGVAIPDVFEFYNDAHVYDDLPRRQWAYNTFMDDTERADRCTACGECLDKCPQDIDIPTWMEKAQAFLAG
ncbi:MAG TPA: aldo/keto reductase [Thermoleophilia bacterium]|nr:aldo/keto reductase [Thermoleophilia bacterium]